MTKTPYGQISAQYLEEMSGDASQQPLEEFDE